MSRGLRVSQPRQIWSSPGWARPSPRSRSSAYWFWHPWKQIGLWPNESSDSEKSIAVLPFRKPEHGKGKRLLCRWRAGSNSDRPGESGGPQSDRPHQRSTIQGGLGAQSSTDRSATRRRLSPGRIRPTRSGDVIAHYLRSYRTRGLPHSSGRKPTIAISPTSSRSKARSRRRSSRQLQAHLSPQEKAISNSAPRSTWRPTTFISRPRN